MKAEFKNKFLGNRRKTRSRTKLRSVNRKHLNRIFFHVSNKNLSAQLIDDTASKTILAVSTLGFAKEGKTSSTTTNKEYAKKLAEAFVAKMQEAKIDMQKGFIFDRGEKKYHGKVKVFADALREKGVKV